MKKIGLLGGLGPEATMEYYDSIINSFKDTSKDLNYPEIIIYSVNMSEFLDMMKKKKYSLVVDYLLSKINALYSANCEFAALTANTPHLLYDEVAKKSPIPLISIVESTAKEAKRRGLKRAGLIGTSFTMNSRFYENVFRKMNMEVVYLSDSEKKFIDHKLFTEIELGVFKDETRKELADIIFNMVIREKIDCIILGCTEFPLILTEKEYSGIPVLNTTEIHVKAIVNSCIVN